MRVCELIEKLKEMPEDYKVIFYDKDFLSSVDKVCESPVDRWVILESRGRNDKGYN